MVWLDFALHDTRFNFRKQFFAIEELCFLTQASCRSTPGLKLRSERYGIESLRTERFDNASMFAQGFHSVTTRLPAEPAIESDAEIA